MTTQQVTRWLGALVALLLVGAGLLLASPAQASIRTVTLSSQGPSPRALTIAKGDQVRFFNNDNVSHTIDKTGTNWSFSAVIEAGQGRTTEPFATAGTFGYTDTYTLVALPQQANGSIVVPATPPPSPTASPKPSPSSSASPKPKPTVAPSVSPTPGPTRSGTAIGPGIGVGGFPTATPSPSTGPRPDIAGPGPSPTGSGAAVAYSDRGLVQSSPHRYGLPAALAVVGIVGVLSLLVRLLLAHPEATSRRTRPVVTFER